MSVNLKIEKEKEFFVIPINNYIRKDNNNNEKEVKDFFINKSKTIFKNKIIKPNL